MPNLILGSTTVITENAGTATIDASLTNASNMPKGVSQGIGYLLRFHTADNTCLLYTSDAADDLLCVDLGGRRIIKKK